MPEGSPDQQAVMELQEALDKVAKLLAASQRSLSGWQQYGDFTLGMMTGSILTILVLLIVYLLYRRFVLQPAAAAGPAAHGGVALGVPQQGFAANAPNAPPGAGWA